MSAAAPAIAAAVALFFCSLTAGFLFAFAVVVMPGLRTLDDGAYLRAFQVVDGIIQDNQPVFLIVWVGSVAAALAVLGTGLGFLAGSERLLALSAGALWLVGVQAPTIAVNVPLNGRVQAVDVGALDARALRAARAAFEARWTRWNVVRTVLAAVVVALLILLLGP